MLLINSYTVVLNYYFVVWSSLKAEMQFHNDVEYHLAYDSYLVNCL